MKRTCSALLTCGLALLITSNIFGMVDGNATQINLDIVETNEDVEAARKIIKLNSYAAWFNVFIDVLVYHSISTIPCEHSSKNALNALLAANIVLNLPSICFDEIDADFYFGIKGLDGLADYGVTGCLLERYNSGDRQFVLLVLALLYFWTGTDKFKKSVHYFLTGEADNLVVPA